MNIHQRAFDVFGGASIVLIGGAIILFSLLDPLVGDEIVLVPLGAGMIGWGLRDVKNGFKAPSEYYEEK